MSRKCSLATNQQYAAYLNSFEWETKRRKVIASENGKCYDCSSDRGLQVHHTSYQDVGNERTDQLVALCKVCHGLRHGITYKPRPKPTPVVIPEGFPVQRLPPGPMPGERRVVRVGGGSLMKRFGTVTRAKNRLNGSRQK